MCLSVCLSIRENISRTTRAIFTNFFLHVAYHRGSVLLRRGDDFPREGAISGVFFPIYDALYSIAFGSHTKTAEPIEMPFGTMTLMGLMGPGYHVLYGGSNPPKGGGTIFWENVATHCKVMGHYMENG